jgi:hypothetical protein
MQDGGECGGRLPHRHVKALVQSIRKEGLQQGSIKSHILNFLQNMKALLREYVFFLCLFYVRNL